MTYFRLALLSISLLLGISACSKTEDTETVEVSQAASELLSYVPADTPYLLGSLEPPPDAVVDTYLARAEPVLIELQSQLAQAKAELEASGVQDQEDDPAARLALAILEELDGKLNRAGLVSMGIDLQADKVFYGLGAFPVGRFGLSDQEVFRATINRILERADVKAPEQEYQGKRYWRLADVDEANEPMALYLSIMDGHLAFSLFPHASESELLPAFLGINMPANSDALERLTALNRAHGYTPYSSGYLDLHKLADRFLQPETVLARLLAAEGEFDPAELEPVCAGEIHGMIENMPMITFGTTELSESTVAYEYRLLHPESLAAELASLVANIPAAEAASSKLVEFAVGLRLGAARDFLREKALAITESPYQCTQLAELNQHASEALATLDQPVPPFVNNFRGLRMSLSEFNMDPSQVIPQKISGHVAVHVEQPQMFVGMAQMFLPDLSGLQLAPGDPPVAIPETLIPFPGAVAYAAMSDSAIAMSLGQGEEQTLPAFLERKNGPEGMFLSADYDMAAYLEYTDRLSDAYVADYQDDHDNDDPAQAIADAASEAFRAHAGRSRTTMTFAADGLVIKGKMTFRNP